MACLLKECIEYLGTTLRYFIAITYNVFINGINKLLFYRAIGSFVFICIPKKGAVPYYEPEIIVWIGIIIFRLHD